MAKAAKGKPSRGFMAEAKGSARQKQAFGKKSPPKRPGLSGDKPKKGGNPFGR